MKIVVAVPMLDNQSGVYVHDTLINMGHKVAYFDWRHVTEQHGVKDMNMKFIEHIQRLNPDLLIIIKGLGITGETIKQLRKVYKNPIVGWIFDVTLGGTPIKDVPQYVDFIKTLDKFYTIDADAIPELEKLGVNADWLSEGCDPEFHKEVVFNAIQRRKYGADIIFLGSIGTIHPHREEFLKRIYDEGFNLKIYGSVFYKSGEEPAWVKECHCGFSAINNYHSLACQSGKIIIGIDGWPKRGKSWSARIYRTLCAGGFLLTNHTKDIEQYFQPGKYIDTYKDADELIDKIVYWLGEDDKREEISKAGQKLVMDKHQFKHRLQRMLDESGAVDQDIYMETI